MKSEIIQESVPKSIPETKLVKKSPENHPKNDSILHENHAKNIENETIENENEVENVKAVKFSAPKKDPNNIKKNPDLKTDTKTDTTKKSNIEKFEISNKKVINRTSRRRKTSLYIAKS